MNVWRQQPLMENPYYRTAFRVTGIPPETVKRRTVVQLIARTRRVTQTDPDEHKIQGQTVTEAEINAAEQVMLNAKKRILHELLEHAAEQLPLDRIRKVQGQVLEALAEQPPQPAVTNLSGLRPWAGELVEQFLDEHPGPDPSFGAFETQLVPPFGRET